MRIAVVLLAAAGLTGCIAAQENAAMADIPNRCRAMGFKDGTNEMAYCQLQMQSNVAASYQQRRDRWNRSMTALAMSSPPPAAPVYHAPSWANAPQPVYVVPRPGTQLSTYMANQRRY